MNYIMILSMFIMVIFIAEGLYKGLARKLYSLIALIVTIVFVTFGTPYVCQVLKTSTNLEKIIQEECEKVVKEKMETEGVEKFQESLDKELGKFGIKLPEEWKNKLQDFGAGIASDVMEEQGIYTEMARPITNKIMQVISFVLALLMIGLILSIIRNFISLFESIPVIKGVNRLLGGIIGFLQGILTLWIIYYIISLLPFVEICAQAIENIEKNPITKVIYENNLIENAIHWIV